MIAKNEEKDLGRCLKSVSDIVDEIIVVDTGSTDRTVKIAKEFGAEVFYYKWKDDFSDARNESIKYASCDWILIMDADDEFCTEDKEKFLSIVNKAEEKIYCFETHSYIGENAGEDISINYNIRLIRNNCGYFFKNPLHEQLWNEDKEKNPNVKIPIKNENIRIYHYGYLNKKIKAKNKRERNKEILLKQIDIEPNNPFHYYNLGNEYFAENDLISALECYNKIYKNFNPYITFSPRMMARMIMANYLLGRYEEALKLVKQGMRYYPNYTDLYYLQGSIYNLQNRYTMAIRSFEKCIKMGEAPQNLKFIHGVESYKAYDSLGDIYLKLKDYNRAYGCFVKCLEAKSDDINSIYKMAHILKKCNVEVKIMKEKIEGFLQNVKDEIHIVMDILVREEYYDMTLKYMNNYEKAHNNIDDISMFFKVRCLIGLRQYDECIEFINTFNNDNMYYFEVNMFKVICLIILEKEYEAKYTLNEIYNLKQNLNLKQRNKLKLYNEFINLVFNKEMNILTENDFKEEYSFIILEILDILLQCNELKIFKEALQLLNLTDDESIFLSLGKLYYNRGFKLSAKNQIFFSIRAFNIIDDEGLDILKDTIE
jgi:glycosyltransferase involved in cell wall biosynthesis